jgi:hypothetical protein
MQDFESENNFFKTIFGFFFSFSERKNKRIFSFSQQIALTLYIKLFHFTRV